MDSRYDRYREREPGRERERGGSSGRDRYPEDRSDWEHQRVFGEPYGEGQQWSADRERGGRYAGEGDVRDWARDYYGRGREAEGGRDRGDHRGRDYEGGAQRGGYEYHPMEERGDDRWGRDEQRRPHTSAYGGQREREGYGWRGEGRDAYAAQAGPEWGSGSRYRGTPPYGGGYSGGSDYRGSGYRGDWGRASPAQMQPSRGQLRRGPKGYKRSDSRIEEDINDRLFQTEHIDSREVQVNVKDGKVVLSGTVHERWMKHAIEDEAAQCPGVQDVENNVRVLGQPHGSTEGRAASTLPLAGTTTVGGAASQFGGASSGSGGASLGGTGSGSPSASAASTAQPSAGTGGNASGSENKGKRDQANR